MRRIGIRRKVRVNMPLQLRAEQERARIEFESRMDALRSDKPRILALVFDLSLTDCDRYFLASLRIAAE